MAGDARLPAGRSVQEAGGQSQTHGVRALKPGLILREILLGRDSVPDLRMTTTSRSAFRLGIARSRFQDPWCFHLPA